jgi:hypothetical protein
MRKVQKEYDDLISATTEEQKPAAQLTSNIIFHKNKQHKCLKHTGVYVRFLRLLLYFFFYFSV